MNFRRLSLLMLAAGVWLTLTVTTAQAAGVVGNGTPGSCKFKALKRAVAEGGTVTFNCGSAPVTINTKATLMIDEDTVIDGGGKVTLDAGGKHRIMLVRNSKTLTVRGLTFRSGYADHRIDKAADEAGQDIRSDGNGGAINALARQPQHRKQHFHRQ